MVNKVILIGNVGGDPEVRTLENGTKVARIRLATTERMYDRQNNETREHTEWHTVTLWRGMANTVDNYVRKGSQLYIEGRLRTREWTDREGNKRISTEILADTMNLLGRRNNNGDNNNGEGGGYGRPGGYDRNNGGQGGNNNYYGGGQQGGGYGSQGYGQGGYRNDRAQQPMPQQPEPEGPSEDADDLPF